MSGSQIIEHETDFSLAWLARAVFGLDIWLRRLHRVSEYTDHPDCIFRMQIDHAGQAVELSDGTRLRPGDRIVNIHLWNEHVPVVPEDGASLAWARRMSRCLEISLRELAPYLASRRDLADVRAIRANMTFGSALQDAQLARISGRYGFEAVPDLRPLPLAARLHRLGENILVSLMVLARNAHALRRDSLRRSRTQVFLSRAVLEQRYGRAAVPAEHKPAAPVRAAPQTSGTLRAIEG